jgi:hypothetical protein
MCVRLWIRYVGVKRSEEHIIMGNDKQELIFIYTDPKILKGEGQLVDRME